MKTLKAISLLALLVCLSAGADEQPANSFITLGTAGGPLSEANRAQPANALIVGKDLYLVDAGDGAAGQLAKAGYRVQDLKGVFLSHNHFDHTGGVLALLGLRMQLNSYDPLPVYGPPGTKAFIDGLLAGMEPARVAAYGMPGASWRADIPVTELEHGDTVKLDDVTVRVAENSHFAIPDNSGMPEKAKSLSLRFDLADRSIVYTGDTGPSPAVASLARNADLLVCEMMDIPAVLETIQQISPNLPQPQLDDIEWHFRAHHLTPAQVGELASRAKVGKLVITHMVPNVSTDDMVKRYTSEVRAAFDGAIVIANDLDQF